MGCRVSVIRQRLSSAGEIVQCNSFVRPRIARSTAKSVAILIREPDPIQQPIFAIVGGDRNAATGYD